MNYSSISDDNATGRWFIAAISAGAALILFMLLALNAVRTVPPPNLGPLMELDYVTIEEPKKSEIKPPPRAKPKKIKQPKEKPEPKQVTETVPQDALPVEPVPAPVPSPMDIPAQPLPRTPPAPPSDQPHRIGSTAELDNVGFEPIYNPKPDYPKVALQARITGYVDVDLLINEKGKVKSFSFETVKGHPSFADAVRRVLPRWRFPPPRIDGKKTSVKYIYRINFTLQ